MNYQKVSIVICTYNRASFLDGCLKSLFSQTCGTDYFELIVVDNNSTDNTHTLLKKYEDHVNFNHFLEPKIGLSHARNLGLEKSSFEYVAYLDDDVVVPQDWLGKLLYYLMNNQPPLEGLGGPLYPFYTTPKPKWFEDDYAIQMGKRKVLSYLTPGQSFIGANMIWKRDFLESLHGFNPNLGYKGEFQILGEETDAFVRAWKKNPSARFLFSPDLFVYHWVPPEKMTLHFQINRYFKHGLTNYHICAPYKDRTKIQYILKKILDLGKEFLKSILAIKKFNQWEKWIYCEIPPIASVWGEICGAFGMPVSANNKK